MRLLNFFKKSILITGLLATLFVGCNSINVKHWSNPAQSVEVHFQPMSNMWGYENSKHSRAFVYINPETDKAKICNVISHEIMHALGYIGHIQWRDDCVFSNGSCVGPFCNDDVDLLKRIYVREPILVYPDADIFELTTCAVYNLNTAAGHELFKVVK